MSTTIPDSPEPDRPSTGAPGPLPQRAKPRLSRYLFIGLLIGARLVDIPIALAAATGILNRVIVRLAVVFPSTGGGMVFNTIAMFPPAWTPTPSWRAVPTITPPEPTATLDRATRSYVAFQAEQLRRKGDWAGCALA